MSHPASWGSSVAPVCPARPPPRPSPPSAAKEYQDEAEPQHRVSVYWHSTDHHHHQHRLQELKETTEREIANISKQELCCLLRSVFRRCKNCLQVGGWHLKTLLWSKVNTTGEEKQTLSSWQMQAVCVWCCFCDSCHAQGNVKKNTPCLCCTIIPGMDGWMDG